MLHGRPLRAGVVLQQTPQLSDDTWRLTAATLQLHKCPPPLNFRRIPASYRRAAKHLVYAMLSGLPPAGEQRRTVGTIRTVFAELQRFLIWLDSWQSATGTPPALAAVQPGDIREYHRHLAVTIRNPAHRSFAGRRWIFWRYRHCMPLTERLSFDPRPFSEWQRHQGRAENATERIPEPVHGPLLGWSMRFTTDFAGDILAACRQWHEYRHRWPVTRRNVLGSDVRRLLAERVARQQPLPGRDGCVNMFFLARAIGCSRKVLDKLATEVDHAAAVVGLTDWTTYELAINGRLDGRPWISGIAVHSRDPDSLETLSRLLQAACYVIIAFLSGMRDSEVKHLRRGCLQVIRDADGRPYRWKLASLAFKGERDPAGTPATWVVGEPVARAIEVLQELQPAAEDLLFAVLPYGHAAGPASRSASPAIGTSATNRQINELAAWISDYCRARDRGDGIPPVNGQPFRVLTRQFRRTLAWFIARQPGGVIAGAIQYRHHSIQMFEGYAGTSASGFRAEVEAEQALTRGEHLLAVIDKHEHEHLTGPAASEAARRLRDFGDRAPSAALSSPTAARWNG